MGGEPEAGDVVIALRIHCHTTSPGLDTKKDRVVRISYRPQGLQPLEKGKKIRPPGGQGAFPEPGDPTKDGPTSGGVVDGDGIIWIDTQLYGQPPEKAPGALGDDSEDMASRISDAIDSTIARNPGKASAADVSVEHNGLSDTDPDGPSGGPCPYGKPQDKGFGLARIVIKKPTHVDASADYSKIHMAIILVEDVTAAKKDIGIQIIPESVPNDMPDERGQDGWIPTGGPAGDTKTRRITLEDPRDPKKKGRDWQKPLVEDALRNDVNWKKPPKKPRKFGNRGWSELLHDTRFPGSGPNPDDDPSATSQSPTSTVTIFRGACYMSADVGHANDAREQLDLLAEALRSLGCYVDSCSGVPELVVTTPADFGSDDGPSGIAIEVMRSHHLALQVLADRQAAEDYPSPENGLGRWTQEFSRQSTKVEDESRPSDASVDEQREGRFSAEHGEGA